MQWGTCHQNYADLDLPHIRAERYHYDEAIATCISDLQTKISSGLIETEKRSKCWDPQLLNSHQGRR